MTGRMYPIQPDFSGGELSPRMLGRTDTERYRRGLKTSLNYAISPQGSLFKRPGFELIDKSEQTDPEYSRLVAFEQAARPDYLVEFTEDTIYLWGPEGKLRNDDDVNRDLVVNSGFTLGNKGLQGWQTRTIVKDVEQNRITYNNAEEVNFVRETPTAVESLLYLFSGAQYNVRIVFDKKDIKIKFLWWTIKIPTVTPRAATAPVIATSQVTQAVKIPSNLVNEDMGIRIRCGKNVLAPGVNRYSKGTPVTSASGKKVTYGGEPEFMDFGTFVGDDGLNSGSNSGAAEILFGGTVVVSQDPYGVNPIASLSISEPGTYELPFNPSGLSQIYLTMTPTEATGSINENEGQFGVVDPFYYFNVYNASIVLVNSIGVQDEYISYPNPFPAEAIKDIRVVSDSATNTMFMFHRSTKPKVLTVSQEGTFINFTDMTLNNISGMDDVSGWPRGGEIHQGRMWLYSTGSFPSRIWASKAGDYFDYAGGTGANNSIDRSVATKGVIMWAKSTQSLLVLGTDQGCYYVYSDGAAASPSDIAVRRFSNASCDNIDAIDISNRIAFVGRNGKTVYYIQYSNDRGTPLVVDLSKYSEHLFKSGIKYIVPLEDPFTQMIAVLNDFTWVQCTFDLDDPEFPIQAWHRHETADGGIISAQSADFGRGDELCVLFSRKNGIYVERMNNLEYTHKSMDMWSQKNITRESKGKFRIHDMLEYKSMPLTIVHRNYILAISDPNYEYDGDDFLVSVDDESVDVDDVVFVGVSYLSKVVTSAKETGDSLNALTGTKRRNHTVYLNIVNSYAPKVNGIITPERDASTPFDTAEPFKNGLVKYTSLGWDTSGEVTITQELPFRSEILSISTETSVER
jgi:hypothetical protein